MDDLSQVIADYKIMEKAFDNIRLVDPENQRVLNYHEKELGNTDVACYAFWGKSKVCEDCVSIRAFQDNKTYAKLEYSGDQIYLVTAIPVELQDRRVVVEILKNISDSLIYDSNENNQYAEIRELLNRMNNRALKDPLTGIYNRRYINEKLPIELANAAIAGNCISIIMADIDFFKKVNDTYGHLEGDRTLSQFAKIVSSALKRCNDWVARFGGEEFLICLPGANAENAKELAEVIREKVEQTEIICGDNKFFITASFGISTKSPEMGIGMDKLLEVADAMLYKAKHNGRNRVEL
ncbi:MAG: diguanylate cyclase [Herbinix sp.]|jgi:diguanylate cyclase (GGDEF)-like protein|nr:diguanylate cyclase [Herbinix sp.]